MKSTMGRAALVVSVGILASRILGFARNVIINGQFGLSIDNDLYQAAFAIPDWTFFLMAGGYLTITLVPIIARHLADDDSGGARRSFSAVFQTVMILMLSVSAVVMLASGPLTRAFFPKFADVDVLRLAQMMRITMASQVFFVAGTFFMAAQYAHRKFLVPTLAPVIYNLGIIGGGLIGLALERQGPEAFVWGGLFGAAIGNFGMQWWGANRCGYRMMGPLNRSVIPEYFSLAIPLMVGQSVVALDELWPRAFGQFAGEGVTAGLTAARQLNMLPVGVIAQAAGVAAYPFLAGLIASGDFRAFRETVERSIRTAFTAAAFAAAIVVGLAGPLVAVAYQRGRFDTTATASVSGYLAVYGLSIPLWAAHQLYTRAFYAQRRMWVPVVIGTVITALTVPVFIWTVRAYGGIAISWVAVASMTVYTMAMAVAWYRDAFDRQTMWVMVKALIAATAAALGLRLVGRLDAGALTQLALGAPMAFVIFAAVGRILHLGEIEVLIKRLRRAQPTTVVQP